MLHKYWFKPARWGPVAVYYPSLFPGWVATFGCLFFLLYYFAFSFVMSTDVPSWILYFAPRAILVFLVFDLICFRTGEYPSWWKVHEKHRVHH